ncbi:phosphoesterase [Geodermatophilus sp. TF02-6]|uniref:bifunctional phosphatase PAP2/diacylglycerol kinase family protein n=1 Tax=Geodermatophilus sp. TF02-6 TaxID=2250575 RepID=UPI000DE9E711|nr:bifunctional phosphatase PAP2/diacylglycerol kinase family protein [Geodermatophilus sp. TF02-6]RBY83860.1 phosphoesterase [Geodermatophilus sp. TF02-6]
MTRSYRRWAQLLTPSPERQLLRALRRWDRAVYRRTAAVGTPAFDVVLPAVSRAADRSLLWLGISGALVASRRRSAHRAARRGLAALAVTSALANSWAKQALPRRRPPRIGIPVGRRTGRRPSSGSFPSGHAASAAAFAGAVGLAKPALAAPLVGLAGAVAYSRVYTGANHPSDVLAGTALGVTVAAATLRLAPMRTPSPVRAVEPRSDPQPPRPHGEGVVAVVNPASGGGRGAQLAEDVRRLLPRAEVVTLQPGDDLVQVLRRAADRAEVLAVGGGDGSVNAAAGVAIEAGLPLLVLPGGTFNHFAADLGVAGAADAAEAVTSGSAIRADVGTITDADTGAERLFLNTASLGAYPHFVAARERWESRLGKRLAAALAIVTVLRSERPLPAVVNGREHLMAMLFIGNGRYQPHGFAPGWRPRLDDGLLDVRLVDTGRRFAAVRLLLSLAAGRLGRSHLYAEAGSAGLAISLPDGPTTLAWDGEIGPGSADLRFGITRWALTVYRPGVRTFP